MQKIYLSRAQTRAMAFDHPVGDPTGGAAYAQKNDPISATVAIASMAGTYAAAGTFAAMTLMQGVAFAGAAIGLVGNVTGNKSLSKIGMVAGLAGGVGMLAESAGAFSSGTLGETFGFGAEAGAAGAAGGAAPLAATPDVSAPAASSVQTNPVNMGNVTSSPLGSIEEALPGAMPNVNAPGAATGSLNAAPTTQLATAPATELGAGMSPVDYSLQGGATPPSGVTQPGASMGAGQGLKMAPGPGTNLSAAAKAGPGFMDSMKAGNYMDAAKAAGSGAMDLAKSNQGAAMMMGQGVQAAGAWLSGKTDAEIAALQAQTGFADARSQQIQEELAKEKRRRLAIQSGFKNVQTGITANPNAQISQPWQQQPQQQPGLIAGARAA